VHWLSLVQPALEAPGWQVPFWQRPLWQSALPAQGAPAGWPPLPWHTPPTHWPPGQPASVVQLAGGGVVAAQVPFWQSPLWQDELPVQGPPLATLRPLQVPLTQLAPAGQSALVLQPGAASEPRASPGGAPTRGPVGASTGGPSVPVKWSSPITVWPPPQPTVRDNPSSTEARLSERLARAPVMGTTSMKNERR
jgi:hypothetical protein